MPEDAAPQKAKSVTPPDPEKPKRAKRSQGRPIALKTELEDLFTQVGALVMMADQFDGLVIINNAEPNADALAKLANKNARVKRALEALTQVSSLGAVAGVVGATAVPILMHHGVIPVQMPMPEDWLKPPEQVAFIAEMKAKAEAEKSQAPGGGGEGGA